jgi:cation transport ATPase
MTHPHNMNSRRLSTVRDVTIVVVGVFLFPWIATRIAFAPQSDYTILWDFIHHTVQAILAVLVIGMGVLYTSMKGALRIGPFTISHAGLVATALFSLAHIGITLHPLQIVYFDPVQIAFTLGLGLFYAIMFDRSRCRRRAETCRHCEAEIP